MGDQKTLTIVRTSYGKRETLPADRDYKIAKECELTSPAGNLADWIAYASEKKYSKVRVIDYLMDEDYEVSL